MRGGRASEEGTRRAVGHGRRLEGKAIDGERLRGGRLGGRREEQGRVSQAGSKGDSEVTGQIRRAGKVSGGG